MRTFERIAKEWYDNQKSRWKPVHAADVWRGFERDLFPDLGHLPIDQIDQPILLAVLGCVDEGDSQEGPVLIQRGFWGGHFDARFDERGAMVLP